MQPRLTNQRGKEALALKDPDQVDGRSDLGEVVEDELVVIEEEDDESLRIGAKGAHSGASITTNPSWWRKRCLLRAIGLVSLLSVILALIYLITEHLKVPSMPRSRPTHDPNKSAGMPGELLITLFTASDKQTQLIRTWMETHNATLLGENHFPPTAILHVKVDEKLAEEMLENQEAYASIFGGTVKDDAQDRIVIEPNYVVNINSPYPSFYDSKDTKDAT